MPFRSTFFELKNMKQIDKGMNTRYELNGTQWLKAHTTYPRIPNTDRVPCATACTHIWRACANVPCNDNELNEFSAWYFSLIIYCAAAFRFNHLNHIWNYSKRILLFVFRFAFKNKTIVEYRMCISNARFSIFYFKMNERVSISVSVTCALYAIDYYRIPKTEEINKAFPKPNKNSTSFLLSTKALLLNCYLHFVCSN